MGTSFFSSFLGRLVVGRELRLGQGVGGGFKSHDFRALPWLGGSRKTRSKATAKAASSRCNQPVSMKPFCGMQAGPAAHARVASAYSLALVPWHCLYPAVRRRCPPRRLALFLVPSTSSSVVAIAHGHGALDDACEGTTPSRVGLSCDHEDGVAAAAASSRSTPSTATTVMRGASWSLDSVRTVPQNRKRNHHDLF